MNALLKYALPIVIVLAVAATPALPNGIVPKHKVTYKGAWNVQPNGDVQVTRTFELPTSIYSTWKQNDLHMVEMRNFSPALATVEAADLDARWDDADKTLTMTMTVRGLVTNHGDHWEARMTPGQEFSNIDQGEKRAYFHFAGQGPLGVINGQDIVQFPGEATDIEKAGDQLVLSYKLPEPGDGGASAWWVLAALCLVGGAGLLAVGSRMKA